MAVFRNAFLTIHDGTQSIDISTFLTEAAVTMGPDQVEGSTIADIAHTFEPGLQNHAIRAVFKTNYGAGSAEEVISAIILADPPTLIAVEFRPNRLQAVGVDNPRFRIGDINSSPPVRGAYIMGPDFQPAGGRVGELITSPILIAPAGGFSIVRETS